MTEALSGRALDAAIATEVMLLHVVAQDWPCSYQPDCGNLEAEGFVQDLTDWQGERHPVYLPEHGKWPAALVEGAEDLGPTVWVKPVPFYSSDGNAMLDVLQRFSSVTFDYHSGPPSCWHVAVWLAERQTMYDARAEGASPPEALARAALAAVRARLKVDAAP